jgi:hypothetical protein
MKRVTKSYKVIIDTNIWISFLIGKTLKGLQNHIDSNSIQIITCNEQLAELSEVLKRPKFQKYFSDEQVFELFELFDEFATMVKLKTKANLCRDNKDNYLVSLAIDSKSNFLVTGDSDLLNLERINNTTVVKYSKFESIANQL